MKIYILTGSNFESNWIVGIFSSENSANNKKEFLEKLVYRLKIEISRIEAKSSSFYEDYFQIYEKYMKIEGIDMNLDENSKYSIIHSELLD